MNFNSKTIAWRRLSIVVPTHDRAWSLERLLDAIAKQSVSKDLFSVMVVNDGTHSDEYERVVSKHSEMVQYLVLEEQVGPAKSRNEGVKRLTSEYIVFTDDDCFPPTDWLNRLVSILGRQSVDVIGGGILPIESREIGLGGHYLVASEFLRRPICIDGEVVCMPTANLAVRYEVFRSVGGFDERFQFAGGEDTDLFYRLKRSGAHILYADNWITMHDHSCTIPQLCSRYFRYGFGVAQHVVLREESLDYGLLMGRSIKEIMNKIPEIIKVSQQARGSEFGDHLRLSSRLFFRVCAFLLQVSYQIGGVRAFRQLKSMEICK